MELKIMAFGLQKRKSWKELAPVLFYIHADNVGLSLNGQDHLN